MNLTAIDFFGKVVWTGGSDQERAERLRAYEATGMEPDGIVEMKRVQALTGALETQSRVRVRPAIVAVPVTR